MNQRVIHLFCDTNLLLQCRPLEELDWSQWRSREVHVIVTKPVMSEIDFRKYKGNARSARRARRATSLFRQMLPEGMKVIQESNPRVVLFVSTQYGRAEELKDKLDYKERDDQIVGTLFKFVHDHPDEDAVLLTHDTGPSYTAIGLNLKVELIPDSWLLEPELDEHQKKIRKLEEELTSYKKQEPSFEISLLNDNNQETNEITADVVWYEPLTTTQIDEIRRTLNERIPEFSTEPKQPAIGQSLIMVGDMFRQGKAEFNRERAKWFESCMKVLRNLHSLLQLQQDAICFEFRIENTGTCPAKAALITIESLGSILTMPPRDQEDNVHLELPKPPKFDAFGLDYVLNGPSILDTHNFIPNVEQPCSSNNSGQRRILLQRACF